jgi:hypothetical protein
MSSESLDLVEIKKAAIICRFLLPYRNTFA